MTSGDYDLVLAGWGHDYAAPLTFGDLFGSSNQKGEGETTRSRSGAMAATRVLDRTPVQA